MPLKSKVVILMVQGPLISSIIIIVLVHHVPVPCLLPQDGILCSKFCVDDPYTIAIGGHENGFQLLNILSCSSCELAFAKALL